jgi:hypothetical protein
MRPAFLAVMTVVVASACGCGDPPSSSVAALGTVTPRRSVVWLDAQGLDEDAALELQRIGVDQLVVRRGSVSLGTGAPVLRLLAEPPVAGTLPVAVALVVEVQGRELDPATAGVMWKGLKAELGDTIPPELILDLPRVPERMAEFISHLTRESGLPVVPLLTPDQLEGDAAQAAVRASGMCIVGAAGTVEQLRPGAEASTQPLQMQLAPLADLGARVRVGIALRPHSEPALDSWGEDLNLLCEEGATTVSTSSSLDRTFNFDRAMEWSGRQWNQGERLAVRWVDAARLDVSLLEASRLVLPEVVGWDLIALPPTPQALGMGREALLGYLQGHGPEPDIEVTADWRRRSLRIKMSNRGPFSTAVSTYGNWVEVAVDSGVLKARDPGSFDRIVLGSRRSGEFKRVGTGAPDAVRFLETYIGPGEEVATGTIGLPSTGARPRITWQLVLTTGEELSGIAVQ